MLKSILTPEAKERRESPLRPPRSSPPRSPSHLHCPTLPSLPRAVNRVAIVKPENARAVEEHVIRLARGGKLGAPVDEQSVIRLLEEVGKAVAAQAGGGATKVVMQRKKRMDDEDDDDDF